MKKTSRIATALLMAGGLTLMAAPAVQAEPGFERGMGMGGKHCPMAEMMGHQGMGSMQGHKGGYGHDRSAGFLRGLDLTEAQEDRIFEIQHALAPAKREYHKEIRKLRDQQRELVQSASYDSGKMKKLVDQETKLTAEHRLTMAEAKHKMYQVLTEEQRKQVAEREAQRPQRPGR